MLGEVAREVQAKVEMEGHVARVGALIASVAPALLLQAGERGAMRVQRAGKFGKPCTVVVIWAGCAGALRVREIAIIAGIAHTGSPLTGTLRAGVAVGRTGSAARASHGV